MILPEVSEELSYLSNINDGYDRLTCLLDPIYMPNKKKTYCLDNGLQYRTVPFDTSGMYRFDRGSVWVIHLVYHMSVV